MAYSDSLYRDTLVKCRTFLVENLTNASRIERLIRRMYAKGHIKEDQMTLLLEYLFDSNDIDMRKVFKDFVSTIKDGKQLYIAKKLEESLDELKKNGEQSEEEMKITRGATSKQSGHQTEKTKSDLMNLKHNKPKKAAYKTDVTKLMFAASMNAAETVSLLLSDSRVNPNATDEAGGNVLMVACLADATEVLPLLLKDKRIHINAKADKEISAIIVACEAHSYRALAMLLKDPRVDTAVVNTRTISGQTPLITACSSQAYRCVLMLLEDKRVDVNARDIYGRTAIMYAIDNNAEKCIAILKNDPRVDLKAKDFMGQTVSDYERNSATLEKKRTVRL